MEWIELEHDCLFQLSQGVTFLIFPGLQQELFHLGGEHQRGYLGPEKDHITRHLSGSLHPATATLEPPESFGFCAPATAQTVLLIFHPQESMYM